MISIDLGSNTIRAIVYDGGFQKSYEKMVKTAENLKSDGIISAQAKQRILTALKEMDDELDLKAHTVVARTTAAMRMASNSQDVIDEINDQWGIEFKIISAEQEAYFTQLAVQSRLKTLGLPYESFVLLDVGGGSTELVVCNQSVESISIDIGIVTMAESYSDKEELIDALYQGLKPMKTFMKEQKSIPSMLISTAGTPTTIASMKHGLTVATYDPTVVNATSLSREDLAFQLHRLLDMNEDERAVHVGIGRADLIVTGVEILRVLLDLLSFDAMLVIDDGLREGIALDYAKNHKKEEK
jgi:exopolyphosphatase / guanosine-5'-triphosphate,3'-diphosphate pyrophosphatase